MWRQERGKDIGRDEETQREREREDRRWEDGGG